MNDEHEDLEEQVDVAICESIEDTETRLADAESALISAQEDCHPSVTAYFAKYPRKFIPQVTGDVE